MNVNIPIFGARRRGRVSGSAALLIIGAIAAAPIPSNAQSVSADSSARTRSAADSSRALNRRFHQKMAAGFVASILLHESAHFAASYAQGYRPHLGLNKGRPTVYSGINETGDRHAQFVFSAAGLTVQDLLDELILDVPHNRGGAFERGLLAGGIGTTLFYVTLGRNANVSDISVMQRTSSLSKTQLSVIFGSVAALHAIRIGLDSRYGHFFAAPAASGGVKAGLSIGPL